MADPRTQARSRTSKVIQASRDDLYRAFLDADALVAWMCPGEMTARVHWMDAREGGGYEMSLFYPEAEGASAGKTAEREDRFTARFVELVPSVKIVQTIRFDSNDPSFAGEMTMAVAFEPRDDATEVTISFENIPAGIRPEDNDAGTRSSLDKLARYVERARPPGR